MKKKILIIIGTRPNFIKVTQFKKAATAYPSLEFKIVHTGQHYDTKMADVFFKQFALTPDFFLNISKGSANEQIAQIMLKLEELITTSYQPDMIMVVGDVNSTLAAALTANKLNIKIAHLESGLRSFDKSMPEEINRILTDSITDYFFITEKSGVENLIKEEKNNDNLFFVGNTMIDTIVAYEKEILNSEIKQQLNIIDKEYVLITMHRPDTVDNITGLTNLANLIDTVSDNSKIVFPVHPRTLKNIASMGLLERFKNNKKLILTEPLDYFSFQNLIYNCKYVLTDSGGVQEETTYLGIPCLTIRPNTERPITCAEGTNTLVPFILEKIKVQLKLINEGNYKEGKIPENWDGKSTQRIVKIINTILVQ